MTKAKEAMQMLDQLQDLLKAVEDTPHRMPTSRAFLMVARAVYWLMEQYIRSEENAAKNK